MKAHRRTHNTTGSLAGKLSPPSKSVVEIAPAFGFSDVRVRALFYCLCKANMPVGLKVGISQGVPEGRVLLKSTFVYL